MKKIEDTHHKEIVKYLRVLQKTNKIITFFAPINETRVRSNNKLLNTQIANKEYSMGKLKGVSDLVIVFKDKVLFLEMKQPLKKLKNGMFTNSHSKPTDEQIKFLECVNNSYVCVGMVGYGYLHAKQIIDECLK